MGRECGIRVDSRERRGLSVPACRGHMAASILGLHRSCVTSGRSLNVSGQLSAKKAQNPAPSHPSSQPWRPEGKRRGEPGEPTPGLLAHGHPGESSAASQFPAGPTQEAIKAARMRSKRLKAGSQKSA